MSLKFPERSAFFNMKNAFLKLMTIVMIACLLAGVGGVALAENESISIRMENTGDIYYGDTVTLKADVQNAESGYSIIWEVLTEDGWVKVGSGAKYSFVVTESNAANQYRAVLIIAE